MARDALDAAAVRGARRRDHRSHAAGRSGIDVCSELRSWIDMPIVVLSAVGDEKKVAALEAGADDYVTKPFGPTDLDEILMGTG